MSGYIAVTVPARIIRVSNTTLFRVAATYLGDALYWTRIAILNGVVDPWIGPLTELKIPRATAAVGVPDGILGAWPVPVVTTPVATPLAAAQEAVIKPALTMEQVVALIPYLPTTLPDSPGILWNDGGIVAIS